MNMELLDELKVKDFIGILLMSGYTTNSYLWVSNLQYGNRGYLNKEKEYYYGREVCRDIQSLLNSKQSEYYITKICFDTTRGFNPRLIRISKNRPNVRKYIFKKIIIKHLRK